MSAAGYLATLPHVDPARVGIWAGSRWLHHAAVDLPGEALRSRRGGDRARDNLNLPPVAQGPVLPVGLRDAEGHPGACRSRNPRSTSSVRRVPRRQTAVPVLVTWRHDHGRELRSRQQIVDALRSPEADLAETTDVHRPADLGPDAAHSFSRASTEDARESRLTRQVDSWKPYVDFFEWNLRKR